MIWEHSCSVIVMLTKEIENGKLKCDRYWPEDVKYNLETDMFTVSLLETSVREELTIRRFELLNKKTQEKHKPIQIQYTGWPDHGLPVSTVAFLEIIDLANKENTNKSPLVVHCSAGIGRSGTFCAVHSNMKKLSNDMNKGNKDKSTLNIVHTILKMREQRPG